MHKLSKRYFKKIVTLLALLLLISLFAFSKLHSANAQTSVRTITITPPTVSVTLDPGGRAEGTMGVINDSDETISFKAEMKDFIVQDNAGTPELLPANTLTNIYSAAAWMGVTPQTFTLQPKQRQDLNYYMQVPITARPGGHYAAVAFTPINAAGTPNTGAIVNGQLGTLFSIAVNGPIAERATVTKFFANGFQEYGPVDILTQIKNFGDLHIRPQGFVTVTNMLGKNTVLPLQAFNIFPQTGRDYANQYGGHWMIGRYKAVLLASYGVKNNLPLTAVVYFWVFPWKITVIIILIIIALILGGMYYRKNGFKKPGKKTEKTAEPKTEEPVKDTTK